MLVAAGAGAATEEVTVLDDSRGLGMAGPYRGSVTARRVRPRLAGRDGGLAPVDGLTPAYDRAP